MMDYEDVSVHSYQHEGERGEEDAGGLRRRQHFISPVKTLDSNVNAFFLKNNL